MIKLFRRIRRRLLTENKLNKYLIYAIGEIILVVIGILIALQINNWNSENQLRKLEIKYLVEIKNNLKADLPDIDYNLKFNKSKLQSNEVIIQYLDGLIGYQDSLEYHLSNLLFSTRTLVNKSAYENIKSRGIEIISNDSLRERITKLYEYNFYNTIDFETQDDHRFQYQILVPEVTKAINIIEFNNKGGIPKGLAIPIDKELLLNNYSFKNALMINRSIRAYMISYYHDLSKNVKECIAQIEKQLE